MTGLTAAADRVRRARGLPAVLDAACDAFEAILAAIGAREDATGEPVVSLLLAATQAANGRDALLFAPSLPPHRRPPQPGHEQKPGSAGDLSTAVTGLSRLLAARLARAATTVAAGADRAACHDAARYATQLRDLLAGAGR